MGKQSPFVKVWNYTGTVGGVVGLASMFERWFENSYSWKGFIRHAVEAYRTLVEPLFDVLFFWVPWQVPLFIYDYLFLGLMFLAAECKGISGGTWKLEGSIYDKPSEIFSRKSIFPLIGLTYSVVVWPFTVYLRIKQALRGRIECNGAVKSLKWFAAIIFGVILLLPINALL